MSRKRKILFGVALALAGAMIFFALRSNDEVRVTFAGVSPGDSNRVSFTITNRSRTPLAYRVFTLHQTNGGAMATGLWLMREDRELGGQSAVYVATAIVSPGRWRICVTYFNASSTPFAFNARLRLAQSASEHHWERLGAWLDPQQRTHQALGPEMLGNRPAP